MIKAVIFDMDGVLADSEPFICEAAIKMFAKKGLTVQPEDFLPFVGTGENRYIGGVAEKYNLAINIVEAKELTYAIYNEIVKGRLEPLDGVHNFIEKISTLGLKKALASSADRIKIDINLIEIAVQPTTFDAIVSGLDVDKKKPDPEIFLKAAQMLCVAPEKCLVVEDAVSGVSAAKAAGMKCLGLTTTFTAKDLYQADWISSTLATAPDAALAW